jgi:hypothetical protein
VNDGWCLASGQFTVEFDALGAEVITLKSPDLPPFQFPGINCIVGTYNLTMTEAPWFSNGWLEVGADNTLVCLKDGQTDTSNLKIGSRMAVNFSYKTGVPNYVPPPEPTDPTPPTVPYITNPDYANNFTNATIGWGASSVQPDNYVVRIYDQGGNQIANSPNISPGSALSYQFAISKDTRYQVRVFALLSGKESGSGALKLDIGHPEVGHWQDTYDWSSYTVQARPTATVDTSGQYSSYLVTNAFDGNTDGTYWLSSPGRSQEQNYPENEPGTFFAGFNGNSPGGYRKLVSIEVRVASKEWIYLGIRHPNGTWYGNITPAQVFMSTGVDATLYHNYLASTNLVGGGANSWSGNPGNVTTRSTFTFQLEGYNITLDAVDRMGITVTQMVNHLNAGSGNFRGYCADFNFTYRDWIVTGTIWVIDIPLDTNGYW